MTEMTHEHKQDHERTVLAFPPLWVLLLAQSINSPFLLSHCAFQCRFLIFGGFFVSYIGA